MTISLESSDFIRMFPTVVWKFQLHEGVTTAINKTILYQLADMFSAYSATMSPPLWGSE